MPVRVALVEDHPAFRQRLTERLRFFADVELVLTADSGDAFLEQIDVIARDTRPEVVIMDIEMPGLSGIETTRRLKAAHPEIDVLMFTVFEHDDSIFASIQAGASGYLLKDSAADQIVGAVLELAGGGAPMSPGVARRVLAHARTTSLTTPREPRPVEAPTATFDLTERELDVLHRLVEADTEDAIADRLHISPHTVRTHIKNIYRKLHVHSRASVVRVAIENRLLDS
ncbi:MAG: response regulator transcription factor [Rhodothermales bacterium]